jgi:hypothetical protein
MSPIEGQIQYLGTERTVAGLSKRIKELEAQNNELREAARQVIAKWGRLSDGKHEWDHLNRLATAAALDGKP